MRHGRPYVLAVAGLVWLAWAAQRTVLSGGAASLFARDIALGQDGTSETRSSLPRDGMTEPLPILLAGQHRLWGEDDLRFARRDWDDSHWPTVRVPAGAQGQGVSARGIVVWYRLRFRVPEALRAADLGVDLGIVSRADETYLNGMRIGGHGRIAGQDGLPSAFPPPIHRVYRLPREHLRYGQWNVLAIRVSGLFGDQGILGDSPRIDHFLALERARLRGEQWSWAAESFLMGIDAMTLVFCLFMFVTGIRDRELIWFGITVLAYTLAGGFEERIPYALGLLTPVTQTLAFLCGSCAVAALVQFFADALGLRVGRAVHCLQGLTIATGLLSCLLFWTGPPRTHALAQSAWLLCWAVSGVLLIGLTGRGIWRRVPEAWPLAIGLGLIVAGTWHATLFPHSPGAVLLGVREFEFVVRGFLICCAFAVVQRYARARTQLAHANGRLRDAHEEERRRLSRELHDGLGQSLNALKLRIDMLAGDGVATREALTDLSEEVRGAISETRQIAHDLRPAMLQQSGLVETLRCYAKRLEKRSSVVITVTSTGGLNIPLHVQDHLYRICQEAICNALRHAAARRVTIDLRQDDGRVTVVVEDDGRGLALEHVEQPASGIGLRSIRERCELLQGGVRFLHPVQGGTRMLVEIPVSP
ncbi:MAG: hypothetical protein J5I93_09920 [Pirellulaceae bacterium]|nr:hypothetical protein [Pirellulaceae bacterium]